MPIRHHFFIYFDISLPPLKGANVFNGIFSLIKYFRLVHSKEPHDCQCLILIHHLYSFQDYISTMVGQVQTGSFWIGLEHNADGGWQWVDNTTVNTDIM